MAESVVGWDVGGAHLKACVIEDGRLVDVGQWPCPLWQGLPHLDAAIALARARWPRAFTRSVRHAATMTGEMTDLFVHREAGVAALTARLAEALGPELRVYAGDLGLLAAPQVARHWAAVASANWQASADAVARRLGQNGVFVDIGSTTTDLIALRHGGVAAHGRSDAQRLARGELVYQGVVRTPLCVLARRVPFDGEQVNVMNEFFATTADVYRLTGELDSAHDQQPTADGAAKDGAASRQRLARLIGRDARDADASQWLDLAQHWRQEQHDEIRGQLQRVIDAAALPADAPLVGAGCGDFLARELARRADRPYRRFADVVLPGATPAMAAWAQVCAPAVAVALLAAGAAVH